jgi:putative ABC transport system substrate-binding protein
MRRRDFIAGIAGSTALGPLAARAQQPVMPVIGFLRNTPAAGSVQIVGAFRQGLKDSGFEEGKNVAIEWRWVEDDHNDRLPALADDLVRRRVDVIVANGPSAFAAKAAKSKTPIVFLTGADPVAAGLVSSLNRPGGNLTGVVFTVADLASKRLGLLHSLVPTAALIAVLLDPNAPGTPAELRGVEQARHVINPQIVVFNAASEHEINEAFEAIVHTGAGALHVGGGPLFFGHRRQIVALASRHALPAIYLLREYLEVGGLMSYGASITDAYRRAGVFAGRILKGEKPADLPVELATKLDLIINLPTAKAFGLNIPPTLLAIADEVIE